MRSNRVAISLLLVVCVALTLLPSAALADGADTRSGKVGPLRYEIENGEATITQCDQYASGKIEVPVIVENCPVTCIGSSAFSGRREITEIVLPDTVQRVELQAFRYCTKLQKICFPNTLTELGSGALSQCTSLTEVALPSGLTTLESGMFEGDSALCSVTLPEGLTDVGPSVFARTALRTITLPQTLTSISTWMFRGCSYLEEIDIPQSVRSIGGGAFESCRSLSRVQMPAQLDSIGSGAFEFCGSLQEITVPEGVKEIERQTFRHCNHLRAVSLPSTLQSIGNRAFEGCWDLNEISIPDNVWQLGEYVFIDSGVTRIALPSKLTRLPAHSLACCPDLIEVIIPASVVVIEEKSFSGSDAIQRFTVAEDNPVYCDIDGVLYTRSGQLVATPPGQEAPGRKFLDVPDDAYYAESVKWAVEREITKGTGRNEFSPDMGCTRGQAVTFLWRAAGCPTPNITGSPFYDVTDPKSYFYDAVLWAFENEITRGVNEILFGADLTVTRAQIVTFLWRAEGQPDPEDTVCSFTDVSESDWYYKPVLWAAENGITNGYPDGTFGSNDTCTRAQIVTFLYRYASQS